MQWDRNKDIFYPWKPEDHYRPVFSAGEPVEVLVEISGPIGTAFIREGVINSVNIFSTSRKVKVYWYHVSVPSIHSGGDVPLRNLRPLLTDQELKERFMKHLDEAYACIQDQIGSFSREKTCIHLSLLERMLQELKK